MKERNSSEKNAPSFSYVRVMQFTSTGVGLGLYILAPGLIISSIGVYLGEFKDYEISAKISAGLRTGCLDKAVVNIISISIALFLAILVLTFILHLFGVSDPLMAIDTYIIVHVWGAFQSLF